MKEKSNIKYIFSCIIVTLFAAGTVFACLFLFRGEHYAVYVALSSYVIPFCMIGISNVLNAYTNIFQLKKIKKLESSIENETNLPDDVKNDKTKLIKHIKQRLTIHSVKAFLSLAVAIFAVVIMFLY